MLNDCYGEIRKLIEVMSNISGFDEFYSERMPFKEEEDILKAFRIWKEQHGGLTANEDITIRILFEKKAYIQQNLKLNKLSGYAHHLTIEDSLVNEFIADFKSCMTGDVKFKKADVQHYKTITEKIACYSIDINPVYHKYRETLDPYINSQLAQIFNRGKMYDLGLWHLQKTLGYIFTYPNPYWDTPIEVYGCTESLWELQYLLGGHGLSALDNKIKRFKLNILEVLFLYISRSVHIVGNSAKSAGYLSNRATLLYDYRYLYQMIFADNGFLATNIDIQFMSDKAYAFAIAEDCGIAMMFEQDYKDSLKMYQHGSLIPNCTGGLKDTEDATMGELNKRGWYRSIELGNRILEKYRQGKYFLDRNQIGIIMNYLERKYING